MERDPYDIPALDHAGARASEALRQRVLGMTVSELAGSRPLRDERPFRARQIASWVFARGVTCWSEMTDLPARLRRSLEESLDLALDPIVRRTEDPAGEATKFLVRLAGGELIECVLIRGRRVTFCISSQVGCAFGCTFCATARMGAGRNLATAEIVSQVLALRRELRAQGNPDSFNVVFMGMGEPLANYDHLVRALRILEDPQGLAIGRRRITVSTVGLPHRIRRLAQEDVAPRLAFSLVATTPELRRRIMPVESRHPFSEVLAALREYREKSGQRVTLEYVLLKGVNDGPEDARRLASLAREAGTKVNVIAFNPFPGAPYDTSDEATTEAFVEILKPLRAPVTVRYSRGRRIHAACGQLSVAAADGEDAAGP